MNIHHCIETGMKCKKKKKKRQDSKVAEEDIAW